MKKNFITQRNKGAAMLISVVFFLFISLAIISGLISPTVREFRNASVNLNSKQSYFLAESGVEDVVYRIKNNLATSASEVLSLGGVEAVTEVENLPDGSKAVSSLGEINNYERRVALELAAGSEGASFHYGVQVGNGGFEISGGGNVYGNVYANGPIIGGGNPTIHGSATSAGEYELVPVVSHGATFPPPYSPGFGYQNTVPQDFAQSFTVPTSASVKRVRLYIKRSTSGWMNDINVRITNNGSGKPGGNTLKSKTLAYGDVPYSSFGYATVSFDSPVALSAGTTYWLVLDTNNNWSARYYVGAGNATYPNGLAKQGSYANGTGGTWSDTSPAGLDMYFDLYPEGNSGLISGTIISGDAWAYEVTNSNITGALNCQVGTSNNKYCDTSAPLPSPLPLPLDEEMIDAWKAAIVSGGTTTTGNVTVDWQGATFGPRKIVGNLTINGGGTLTLTGDLWVTGSVQLTAGGHIQSSSTSESRIIISDSQITINGGGSAVGTIDSYILFVTTSTSSTAINLSGGAGTAILSSPFGTLKAEGGSSLKSGAAWKIILTGGGSINYETGLIDQTFTSGPSGSWTISDWGESE